MDLKESGFEMTAHGKSAVAENTLQNKCICCWRTTEFAV